MAEQSATSVFEFPPCRFPSFEPVPRDASNLPAERYGPRLAFDPLSDVYSRSHINFEQRGYQFVPEGQEIDGGTMEIFYNVVDDAYTRPRSGTHSPVRKGWNNCTWRYCNVARKEERDWNMGYVARQDIFYQGKGNTLDAFLEFRFNLSPAGKKVKRMRLRLPSTTFRDGKVRVLVCCSEDYTVLLDAQQMREIYRAQGWDDFIVRVELSGTQDAAQSQGTSYQNAQIFRQSLLRPQQNPEWYNPLHVLIEMENAA